MQKFRVKSLVGDKVHIYPNTFDTQDQVDAFLKQKIPDPELIPRLIKQGLITIYRESVILNRDGKPIEIEGGRI